jgi:hypothetical protein
VAAVLVLVVGIVSFLVACDGNTRADGEGRTNTGSSDTINNSGGLFTSDRWDGLIIGWGKLDDELANERPPIEDIEGRNHVVVDTNLYLRYLEENYRDSGSGRDYSYSGQELTLVKAPDYVSDGPRFVLRRSNEASQLDVNGECLLEFFPSQKSSVVITFESGPSEGMWIPPLYYSESENRVYNYDEVEDAEPYR